MPEPVPGRIEESAARGRIEALCALLIDARRSHRALPPLPAACAPLSVTESYAVQDALITALGGRGGWKVGAASPAAEPTCSPLPRIGLHADGVHLDAGDFNAGGLEVEIAFRFGHGLPARDRPYARDEVLAAVASVHAAIEIVDFRFEAGAAAPALDQCADLCSHGALIVGPATGAPATIDQTRVTASLWVAAAAPSGGPPEGQKPENKMLERRGGNAAGDVQRLLVWLVHHAAARGTPIAAGDIVTTGSCTPLFKAGAGLRARGVLGEAGEVALAFR